MGHSTAPHSQTTRMPSDSGVSDGGIGSDVGSYLNETCSLSDNTDRKHVGDQQGKPAGDGLR